MARLVATGWFSDEIPAPEQDTAEVLGPRPVRRRVDDDAVHPAGAALAARGKSDDASTFPSANISMALPDEGTIHSMSSGVEPDMLLPWRPRTGAA